jgi:hypothetical protein
MALLSRDWAVLFARLTFGASWRDEILARSLPHDHFVLLNPRVAADEHLLLGWDGERRPLSSEEREQLAALLTRYLRRSSPFSGDLVAALGVCLGRHRVAIPGGLLRSLVGIRRWLGDVELPARGDGLFAERHQDVLPISVEMLVADIDLAAGRLPDERREIAEGMLTMTLRRYAVAAAMDFLPIRPARMHPAGAVVSSDLTPRLPRPLQRAEKAG